MHTNMVKIRILLIVFALLVIAAVAITLINVLKFAPKEESAYRGARLVMLISAEPMGQGAID